MLTSDIFLLFSLCVSLGYHGSLIRLVSVGRPNEGNASSPNQVAPAQLTRKISQLCAVLAFILRQIGEAGGRWRQANLDLIFPTLDVPWYAERVAPISKAIYECLIIRNFQQVRLLP